MHHRLDVPACPVDPGVNEPLEEDLPTPRVDRIAVAIEFQDVVALNQRGCQGTRHQEVIAVLGVPNADMSEPIHHALVRQDVIGGDEILDDGVERRP